MIYVRMSVQYVEVHVWREVFKNRVQAWQERIGVINFGNSNNNSYNADSGSLGGAQPTQSSNTGSNNSSSVDNCKLDYAADNVKRYVGVGGTRAQKYTVGRSTPRM